MTCRRFEADLLRLSGSHAQQSSRHASLQRAVRYIREHLAEDISLTDVAAAAFLSPNYLAHLLKKETGKTFTHWVTDRRLEFAQGLLMHSSQRVASIAHASGFADEAYFVRRFRQRFGNTPKAYRDSVRARTLQVR